MLHKEHCAIKHVSHHRAVLVYNLRYVVPLHVEICLKKVNDCFSGIGHRLNPGYGLHLIHADPENSLYRFEKFCCGFQIGCHDIFGIFFSCSHFSSSETCHARDVVSFVVATKVFLGL